MRIHRHLLLVIVIVILAWFGFSRLYPGSKRSHGPNRESSVEVFKDLSYDDQDHGETEWHKLDLYVPKGRPGFPVVIFVHGGSWVSGSKDEYAALGMNFARLGIGAVVINYRLSPDVRHPVHTRDAARAFAWTRRHIESYGGRPDQIFVCGHSSGGHIVALLGCDESYLRTEKLSFANLRGAIPISGEYLIKRGRWDAVFGEDEEAIKRASPVNVIEGRCPPFLILYADGDGPSVGKHSEQFCAALRAKGTEANSVELKNRTHAGIVRKLADADDAAMEMIRSFIARETGPAHP